MDRSNRFKILLQHLLPELSPSQYKGNSGKVVVVGGSQEYTGAPYYSAVSALRSGADLSHIFCPVDALIPIKCYSPEIIVHPNTQPIQDWFTFSNTFVVGPGLGRSADAEQLFHQLLLKSVNIKPMCFILDADALWFISKNE